MKEKILVVDNHPVILKLLANLLGKQGYEVRCAEGSLEALDILKEYRPDVIFVDLVMPNITGDKLCRIIRGMPGLEEVYIVVLTAIAAEEKVDFTAFGADACIAKGPFKNINDHIATVLECRRRDRETGQCDSIVGLEGVFQREITKELLSARKHYEIILANISEAILELTGDRTVVYANPAAVELAGKSEQVLLTHDFADLFEDDSRPAVLDLLARLADEPLEAEATGPLLLNQRRVALHFLPINDEGRRSVIVIIRDVTERKRAEAELERHRRDLERLVEERTRKLSAEIEERKQIEIALRESEARYRDLYNNSSDAIFIHDPEGRFLDVNAVALKRLGYSRKELLNMTPVDLERTGRDGAINEAIQQVREQGYGFFEMEQLTRDGRPIPTEINARLISYGGQPAILALARDISERKQAEAKARLAEREWSRTFDAISDIVTILDREMRIKRVNAAACRLLGRDPEALIGKHCYEVFGNRSKLCDHCPREGALERKTTCTVEIEHANLSRTFLVSITPILDEDGTCAGLAHFARDITDHKQLEAQFRQAQKMEAIGTLAGGIAHDFNNILGAILGYTELAMREAPEGGMLLDNLKGARGACLRAKDLVAQILSFSRQRETRLVPIQIHPIIKEALKMLRSSLPKTIRIEQEINAEADKILADPIQIHQALMNLCTNAAQAMGGDDEGVLKVCLGEVVIDQAGAALHPDLAAGSYLRLSVSDTGPGVGESLRERIFEPFFTTKETGEGTGLGLSVVHGIVKNHDGAVEVESVPGQGATFHLFFPCLDPADRVAEEEIVVMPPTGRERILFVDDEPALAQIGERILGYLGYQVDGMTSSTEALARFRNDPDGYDLVVTDLSMPRMTGIQLTREILRIRPDIPIVLCTGFSELLTEDEAGKLGIREYVVKPLSVNGLARVVRKALEK